MINPEDIEKKIKKFLDSVMPSKDRPQLSKEQSALIEKELGWPGGMISGSKTAPKSYGREHLVVWNSNLVVEGFGKVWYGDINITVKEEKIKKIALALKAKVYVLREHDGRFENENSPKLQNAVYITDGVSGEVGQLSQAYYERVKGKIYLKERLG